MNLFGETEFVCGELKLRKRESRGSGAEQAQHRNNNFWKKKYILLAMELGFSKRMLSDVLLMPRLCLDVQGGALKVHS